MVLIIGAKSERVDELEDRMFFGAHLSGSDLVFELGSGELNVGRIIPPALSKWPVGSIFWNIGPTNPATLLGGGTWVRWAQGRIPVSLDETNTRFDTTGDTGGLESVTLDLTQIPSHDHATGTESASHTHTGYTSTAGEHTHAYTEPVVSINKDTGTASRVGAGSLQDTGSAGSHNHTVQSYGASAPHTHVVSAAGGGLAHENMPPFITVYMWKRTA